jgi:HD-like signal output (HDOD) protein
MPNAIDRLFDQIYRIPSVPDVVCRLIQELTVPEANLHDLARDVARDPSIAMKVLRLVNSAYYGLPRKLTAIDEAVLTLGVDRLATIIIASGMVATVPQMQGFDLRGYWMQSFRRASYAKGIAALVDGVDANTAFTCGLIADFGRLLLRMGNASAAERIDSAVAEGGHRPTWERAELGYSTAEVAAELCRRWNFPEELHRGVAQCAEPLTFAKFDPLAAVVHLAGQLAELRAENTAPHEVVACLPAHLAARLGLGEAELQQIAYRVYDSESGLEGLAA